MTETNTSKTERDKAVEQRILEWSMSCDRCGERAPLKSKVGSDWLCNDCIKHKAHTETEHDTGNQTNE